MNKNEIEICNSKCVRLPSKRFRLVSEQKTRDESQRPREKWLKWKSGEGVGKKGRKQFPSFAFSFSLFYFLALVSFLALSKPKISFLGVSLLRNQTETIGTQAKMRLKNFFVSNHNVSNFCLKAKSENGCEKWHFMVWNRTVHPHQEFPGVPSPILPYSGWRIFFFRINSWYFAAEPRLRRWSAGRSLSVALSSHKVQTLTTKDCKGPQTKMPKNVGSIKTWSAKIKSRHIKFCGCWEF